MSEDPQLQKELNVESEINPQNESVDQGQVQQQQNQDDEVPTPIIKRRRESKRLTALQLNQKQRKKSDSQTSLYIIGNILQNISQFNEQAQYQIRYLQIQLAKNSLFLFNSNNKLRIGCVWIIEYWLFNVFMITTIFGNTVLLMMQDYSSRLDGLNISNQTQTEQTLELTFAIIFQIEFFVKIIALGFIFGYKTYLRDAWNILDFIVFVNSIFNYIPWVDSVSWLRVLRILRPLRSINSVKGMKVLVKSLIVAMPDLANIVLFMLFIIILFGILSLQLFSDAFEYRCRQTEFPIDGKWPPAVGSNDLCNPFQNNCAEKQYIFSETNRFKQLVFKYQSTYCKSYAEVGLPEHPEENQIPELNYGYTKFDNILTAIFSIFQSITMEGWSDILRILLYAQDDWIVYIYFIALVITGPFLVLNLILAVINDSFLNSQQKIKTQNSKNSSNTLGSNNIESFNKENDNSNRNLLLDLLNNSQNILQQSPTIKKTKSEQKSSNFKETILEQKKDEENSNPEEKQQDVNNKFIEAKNQQTIMSLQQQANDQMDCFSSAVDIYNQQNTPRSIIKKKLKYNFDGLELSNDNPFQNEIQREVNNKYRRRSLKDKTPFNKQLLDRYAFRSEKIIKIPLQNYGDISQLQNSGDEIPNYEQFASQISIDAKSKLKFDDINKDNDNIFDKNSLNENLDQLSIEKGEDFEYTQDIENQKFKSLIKGINNGSEKQNIQEKKENFSLNQYISDIYQSVHKQDTISESQKNIDKNKQPNKNNFFNSINSIKNNSINQSNFTNSNIHTIQQNIKSLVKESFSQINLDSNGLEDEQEIQEKKSINQSQKYEDKRQSNTSSEGCKQSSAFLIQNSEKNQGNHDVVKQHNKSKSAAKDISQRLETTNNDNVNMKTAETSTAYLNRITSQKSDENYNKNLYQRNSFILRKTTSQTFTHQQDDSPRLIKQQDGQQKVNVLQALQLQQSDGQNQKNQTKKLNNKSNKEKNEEDDHNADEIINIKKSKNLNKQKNEETIKDNKGETNRDKNEIRSKKRNDTFKQKNVSKSKEKNGVKNNEKNKQTKQEKNSTPQNNSTSKSKNEIFHKEEILSSKENIQQKNESQNKEKSNQKSTENLNSNTSVNKNEVTQDQKTHQSNELNGELKISYPNKEKELNEKRDSLNFFNMKQSTKSQSDFPSKQTFQTFSMTYDQQRGSIKESQYTHPKSPKLPPLIPNNKIEKNYNYFTATITQNSPNLDDVNDQTQLQPNGEKIEKFTLEGNNQRKEYQIKHIMEESDEIQEVENQSIKNQPQTIHKVSSFKVNKRSKIVDIDSLSSQQKEKVKNNEPNEDNNGLDNSGENDDKKLEQLQSPKVRFNDEIVVNYPKPVIVRKRKSPFKVIRKMIENLVESHVFFYFFLITTILNTVILSMDRYPISNSESQILNTIGDVCTYIFMYEMVTKMIAFGIKEYLSDKFNLLDSLIVVSSVIEIVLESALNTSSGLSSLSVLRSLRLFRIMKLYLLIAIFNSLSQIKNFFILTVLFMIVMGLVGMEFFAYFIRFDDQGNVASDPKLGASPRMNFDNFSNSLITVFSITTNDSWNNNAYDLMRAMGSWWPGIYCIIIILIGNFVLLKLLLAILIFAFGVEAEQEKQRQRELLEKRKNRRKEKQALKAFQQELKQSAENIEESEKQIGSNQQVISSKNFNTDLNQSGEQKRDSIRSQDNVQNQKNSTSQQDLRQQILKEKNYTTSAEKMCETTPQEDKQVQIANQLIEKKNTIKPDISLHKTIQLKNMRKSAISIQKSQTINPNQRNSQVKSNSLNDESMVMEKSSPKLGQEDSVQNSQDRSFRNSKTFQISAMQFQKIRLSQSVSDKYLLLIGKSLFIFKPSNSIRIFLYELTQKKQFEIGIVLIIFMSSVLLCLDDPFEESVGTKYVIMQNLDIAITFIFIFESLALTISYGFILNGKNSYLRNISNILDFIVIIISLINNFITDSSSLKNFKVLRLLRVIRPLRLVSKNEGISLAINSLIRSIPNIFNLILINIFFYIIFGVFGVNNLKGQFFYCNTHNSEFSGKVVTKNDCIDVGGDWVNQFPNFDNIGQALISLFILSLTEGWETIMWTAVDSVNIDVNPVYNHNKIWCIYFVFILICCNFYLLNIFAGIVVDSFYTEKNKLGGYALLTNEQQKWVDLQLRIIDLKPIRLQKLNQNQKYRQQVQNLLESKYFEPFILGCIILNTLAFTLSWNRQDDTMVQALKAINYVFLTVFSIEAVLKIFCFHSVYFKDQWNLFDFVVLVLTFFGLILEQIQVFDKLNQTTSIIRTFKIARVVRMIKKAKSLRLIFTTFIISLPAFANIGGLLFLMLFIYAIIGFNVFPYLKFQPNGLNDSFNFHTFLKSVITLFKFSTGENWNFALMNITSQSSPDFVCFDVVTYYDYVKYGKNGCGNSFGNIYFLSFQLIFGVVLLNLFIAVILEGYDKVNSEEKSSLKPDQVNDFITQWKILDKNATTFIKARQIFNLLDELDPPLGWKGLDISLKKKRNLVGHFMIPLYNHKKDKDLYFYFYDVLKSMSKLSIFAYAGFVDIETNLDVKIIRDTQNQYNQKEKEAQRSHIPSQYNSFDLVAMLMIADLISNFKNSKKRKESLKNKNKIDDEQNKDNNDNENNEIVNFHYLYTQTQQPITLQTEQNEDTNLIKSKQIKENEQVKQLTQNDNDDIEDILICNQGINNESNKQKADEQEEDIFKKQEERISSKQDIEKQSQCKSQNGSQFNIEKKQMSSSLRIIQMQSNVSQQSIGDRKNDSVDKNQQISPYKKQEQEMQVLELC